VTTSKPTWCMQIVALNTRTVKKRTFVGFEVFTAEVMQSIIFWDMTPCSLLPWRWRRYVPPKRRLTLFKRTFVYLFFCSSFNEAVINLCHVTSMPDFAGINSEFI
jgi:hypothetical protein